METKETKNIYRKLNNYDYSNIDQIKQYILHKTIPQNLSVRDQNNFLKKYSSNWGIRNNKLVFLPLNLIVVENDNERQQILKDVYKDPVKSLAKGQKALYASISHAYLNISREDIINFLKKQPIYQMTYKPPTTKENKPIFATYPNEKWALDLIDNNFYIENNRGYRYILTVVDYFSRKCFAVALKEKEVEDMEKALDTIYNTQSDHTFPKTLITDNGSENYLDDYCAKHHIKLKHTEAHMPTQNAIVENLNGQIRRLMRANFVRVKSLNWVDHLQTIVDSLNSRVHKTTKKIPNEIWQPDKKKIKPTTDNKKLTTDKTELQSELLTTTLHKAKIQNDKVKNQSFKINDPVRIALKALSSKVREFYKKHYSKYVVIKFTPEIYKVDQILKGRNEFEVDKYILRNLKGEQIIEMKKNKDAPDKLQYFKAIDLILADPTVENQLKNSDVRTLNKFDRTKILASSADAEPVRPIRQRQQRNDPVIQREKSTRTKKAPNRLDL